MTSSPITLDQCTGCLLGLATGDALGAPREGGPTEQALWRIIGRTRDGSMRWTDDTQMSLDLAESLLEHDGVDPDAIAQRFAQSYRWSRGYGAGAARVLKRIRRGQSWQHAAKAVYAEGSFGNGAAMRAPVLALFFADDRDQLVPAARVTASITHTHPLGIEGAVLIALSTHALLHGLSEVQVLELARSSCVSPEMTQRLTQVVSLIAEGANPDPREVASLLGNGMTALTSCPTALHIALRHVNRPFDEMLQFIIRCRGDVDTIAAMAGAMWGVRNGAARLPDVRIEAKARIVSVAARLHERMVSRRVT